VTGSNAVPNFSEIEQSADKFYFMTYFYLRSYLQHCVESELADHNSLQTACL